MPNYLSTIILYKVKICWKIAELQKLYSFVVLRKYV